MNIKKEFVPYKEALELKELGFDEPCFGNYADDNSHTLFVNGNRPGKTDAPTYSQAFRWFREKYKLDFTIITNYTKINSKLIKSYRVGIIIVKNNIINSYFLRPENDKLSFIEFTTYEEAELACLRKLIEIIKNDTRRNNPIQQAMR